MLSKQTEFTDGPIRYGVDLKSVIGCDPSYSGDIIIPPGVKTIAEDAFRGCLVSSVTLTDVVKIEKNAFRDCMYLASVDLGPKLRSVSKGAFRGCFALSEIVFPDSLEKIGGKAFRGCTGLSSICFGNGVKSIGDAAFSGCSGLQSIELPDSLEKIGEDAFLECTELISAAIPNSVTEIGRFAFSGCSSLLNLRLPNRLDAISEGLLSRCVSLRSVSIPNSVRTIGAFSFTACTHLRSVRIPANVVSIGGSAFSGCDRLTKITFNSVSCADLTFFSDAFAMVGQSTGGVRVAFGKDVRRIPAFLLFKVPNITAVSFPENITEIGRSAFEGFVFADERGKPVPPTAEGLTGRSFRGTSSGTLTVTS